MGNEIGGTTCPGSPDQDRPGHGPAGVHDLNPETCERLIALARAVLARCPRQPADREDIQQEALCALLRAQRRSGGVAAMFGFLCTALWYHEMNLRRANARAIGALPEGEAELPGRDLCSGCELELEHRVAEMPRLYRKWTGLFLHLPSPAAIARHAHVTVGTVHSWRRRIEAWIRNCS